MDKLDQLTPNISGAIQELMDYDFVDHQAQGMFQELLDMLRGRMAKNFSQELKQRLQGMSPQEMAGLRDMLRQLNQMLRDRLEGQEPDFDGFMQQYGPLFSPNPPQTLDELLEQIQQQLTQMQSVLQSMSPEARQELQELLDSVFDSETQQEMARFAALMEHLLPMNQLRREYPFIGDENITLDEAMRLMGNLQQMEDLGRTLREAMRTGDLEDMDPNTLAELLAEEARRCTQQGILINTFMLENSYQLINFVEKLTRINRGRAFYSSPNRLGVHPGGLRHQSKEEGNSLTAAGPRSAPGLPISLP